MHRIARRADSWLALFSDPSRALAYEMRHASLEEGAKHLLMGTAAFSVLFALTFPLLPGMPKEAQLLDAGKTILFVAANTILAFGAISIVAALDYAVAVAFGGRGKFAVHYHMNALATAPALVAYYAARLFPGFGWLLSFVVLALYALVIIEVVKAVHKLPASKAFASVFLPSALILLLAFALGLMANIGPV